VSRQIAPLSTFSKQQQECWANVILPDFLEWVENADLVGLGKNTKDHVRAIELESKKGSAAESSRKRGDRRGEGAFLPRGRCGERGTRKGERSQRKGLRGSRRRREKSGRSAGGKETSLGVSTVFTLALGLCPSEMSQGKTRFEEVLKDF